MPELNHQVLLNARPRGVPTLSDFRTRNASVPRPIKGQVLLRNIYASVDPLMRLRMNEAESYAPTIDLGDVIGGSTISRVEASGHRGFKVGDLVLSEGGWQDYSLAAGSEIAKLDKRIRTPSHALGVLGMPGFTAYHGLMNIGQPAAHDTVVVGSASGAVGSVVGQLAKLKGARAVGIAGSAEKCRYVVERLGFDACVDHHSPTFSDDLANACPKDIDIYFENIGGRVLDTVLPLLNIGARVPVCGMTAHYNDRSEPFGIHSAQKLMISALNKRVRIEGFIHSDHKASGFERFLREMSELVERGAVKIQESFVDGLDLAPQALIDLLTGKSFGKLVVRV